jgi:signal transduction histidine kinase
MGGVTDTSQSPAGTDVWQRTVVGWDLAFWLVVLLGLVRLATAAELTGRERLGGAVLLAVLAAAYLLMGSARQAGGWRTHAYLVVAVIVSGLACSLDFSLSLVLFIAYPQVWVLTDSLRAGAGYAVALSIGAAAGLLSRAGWSWSALRDIGPTMVVSLLFSVLLGLWISRVIDQSQDRAELIKRLEATQVELAEANHARGVTAERERLAREIHDTLAQGFTSVVTLAQAAAAELAGDPARVPARLEAIEEVARQNLAEARALVAAFAPVDLDGASLPEALSRLARRFGDQTGLPVELDLTGVAGLTRSQEVVVLRVVQEALTNVHRHAQARQVLLRLVGDLDGIRVEVSDDGVGFTPGQHGFGLAGMHGRVQDVGGDLDVASRPGAGTRVTVRVPLLAAEV